MLIANKTRITDIISMTEPIERKRAEQEHLRIFISACETGELETVKHFLDEFPHYVDVSTGGNVTPLMRAAGKGQTTVMSELLARGANIDAQAGSGHTALLSALMSGQESAVQFLLDNNADMHAGKDNGRTPHSWAMIMKFNRKSFFPLFQAAEEERAKIKAFSFHNGLEHPLQVSKRLILASPPRR